MYDKKQEINEYLDWLKNNIKKKYSNSGFYMNVPEHIIYFIEILQDKINEIFDKDNDYIRW